MSPLHRRLPFYVIVASIVLFLLVTMSCSSQTGISVGSTPMLGSYPNPFNPHTIIRYSTVGSGAVKLAIYDIHGRMVRVLENRWKSGGKHAVAWNGRSDNRSSVASGVYLVRLETAGQVRTEKIILSR